MKSIIKTLCSFCGEKSSSILEILKDNVLPFLPEVEDA
jgi:hypothetical protein